MGETANNACNGAPKKAHKKLLEGLGRKTRAKATLENPLAPQGGLARALQLKKKKDPFTI